jgi:hypothetical protein
VDEGRTVAREFTQLTLGTIWDEAGAQQAMAQQVGDPLGVFDVGLAPWDRLDVLRIDDQHLEAAFQQVVDRLPKHSRGFHCHLGAARRCQPIAERQQIVRHRAERADLLGGQPRRSRREQTGDHRALMDIQATAARRQDLHRDHSLRSSCRPSSSPRCH